MLLSKYILIIIFITTKTNAKEDPKIRAKYENVSTSRFFHNIGCHWGESVDDLPYGDTLEFSDESIFFIETTCRGCIDLRQACSVESAARAHPKRPIIVFFVGAVSEVCLGTEAGKTIAEMKNVRLYRIHISEYTKGTPLEPWFQGQYWKNSMKTTCFPVHHTSDVLRFVTLYKFGGIYLDLDVIVVRPFDWLGWRNFIGKQNEKELGTAVMSISKDPVGKAISKTIMQVLDEGYQPKNYNFRSVGILTKAVKKVCGTTNVTKVNKNTCPDFRIYSSKYFYPISHKSWEEFFKPGPLYVREAFAFHVWNKLSQDEAIVKGSPYAKLARRFCPAIYSIFNDVYKLSRKRKKPQKPKVVENEDYIV